MESLEIVLDGRPYSEEEKKAFAEEKNAVYREYLASLTPEAITDNVRDTLVALKKNGIKIAIGSSSKNTKFILERVGLLHEFDAVADGMDIARCKPDPEVFLLAAKRIGVQPSDCMVVEDAEAGI